MFKFDRSEKIDRDSYKETMKMLSIEMGRLQRRAKEEKIPILIILEGLDASGKGAVISELLMSLDPRGYNVYSNNKESEEEQLRPLFWRFWKNLPGEGEITIFDRSWYYSVFQEEGKEKNYKKRCKDIIHTEELLTREGMLIVKFFLYISKKEQKKRLEELGSNPSTSWKVSKEDRKNNKNYDEIMNRYEKLIKDTHTKESPWNIIFSEDFKEAKLQVIEKLDQEIKKYLGEKRSEKMEELPERIRKFNLDEVRVDKVVEKEKYKKKLKKYQRRLHELEHEIYEKRIPVVIAYEGWDAAGKGGNIKRLVEKMDPRGYDVIPVAAPTDTEKAHHYLWRFWSQFPKGGHMAIFDRTWYGRVLVERVEKFCSENQWKRAYSEINQMESQWTGDGAVVLKFWIHIDQDEQLRRFQEREAIEYKTWKITDEDWRNREKWDDYRGAVEDMVRYTGTKKAPWHVIGGNSKYNARLRVMEIVIEALEERLKE